MEHIIPFGANLLTVDERGALAIFDIKSEEMIREIDGISSKGISSIMHPLTFQNKILIGTTDGFLQLWNINSVRIIHQFDRFQGKSINILVQVLLINYKVFCANCFVQHEYLTFNCRHQLEELWRWDCPQMKLSSST